MKLMCLIILNSTVEIAMPIRTSTNDTNAEIKTQPLTAKTKVRTFQPANIGPQDILRTSSSNALRTSFKHLIWPTWGGPHRMLRFAFTGTSWINLSGRVLLEVFRTSLEGPSEDLLKTLWGRLLDDPSP